MKSKVREITITEFLPSLETSLVDPVEVRVRLEIKPHGGTLNFVLVDMTDWPDGSKGRAVMRDASGNTCLVVERDEDRIFHLELSPNWRWEFDHNALSTKDAITYKGGDAALYKVIPVGKTKVMIEAKANTKKTRGGARDFFNIYVKFFQDIGDPISIRIDPITENPPPKP